MEAKVFKRSARYAEERRMNFEGQTVLITGGTGSFGQYMTDSLLKLSQPPQTIRIFSRDEEKQLDMQRKIEGKPVQFIIGDVRDLERVKSALDGVDVVFHAAALKIIPACEKNVTEAIRTNIEGTLNVKRASVSERISRCILISTDKAVKPVNLYGMTKAVAEKLWLDNPAFTVVRYGNVLGSRGSIAPFFKALIERKKPIPVTDFRMTRFLLTLEQATNLVLEAALAKHSDGKIWVPIIPAHKVTSFVEAMANKIYPTYEIGIRPGEKLHECLINEYEITKTTRTGDHYIIDSYAEKYCEELTQEYTSENAAQLEVQELRRILAKEGWT